MYTGKVAKYVADKGISIKKISERTGIHILRFITV